MNAEAPIEEFEGLPLRLAYQFLATKGLQDEAEAIRQSRDRYKSYTSTLKRGKIVELLEKHGLLDEFIAGYWSLGRSEAGRRRIRRYRAVCDGFLNADEPDDEAEDESIEGTSFAYEEDLKDYLSKNLGIIEPGLTLFRDKGGVEGIEYPIDPDNRRVDILALDARGIPVVVELKVSRGYEKVVGQCLYYRNRVKQLTDSPRVRIVIIAREISPQLRVAAQDLTDVQLFEYKLSVRLQKAA